MTKTLQDLNIVDILPSSIENDETIQNVSAAIQPLIDGVTTEIPSIEILRRLDELPEPMLRMLAWENGVYSTEWQLADTVESKIKLVEDSFQLNKRRGTRWSVERVFTSLGIPATLFEWFEYGGDPYMFRIDLIDLTERGITQAEVKLIDKMIDAYKPLRSHVEYINLSTSTMIMGYSAVACQLNGVLEIFPAEDSLSITQGEVYFAAAPQYNAILELYPDQEV